MKDPGKKRRKKRKKKPKAPQGIQYLSGQEAEELLGKLGLLGPISCLLGYPTSYSARESEKREKMYTRAMLGRWLGRDPDSLVENFWILGKCFERNVATLGKHHRMGIYRYESD